MLPPLTRLLRTGLEKLQAPPADAPRSSRRFAPTPTDKDIAMLEHNMHLSNHLEESVNDELFDSLIDVLTSERSVYQELKSFLISEKDMLVKSSAFAEINKSNAAKENIILKVRISQEARINLLKKISRNLDINEEGASLASLAVYAGSGKRQTIENLRNDLLQISAEIELINKENSYILDKSIYNVKASLEFLTSLLERSGIYLGNGKIGIMQNNGRLLSTEG